MNGPAHAVGSGTAMAIAAFWASGSDETVPKSTEERIATAAAAGGLGALCGSLPDVLEPAIHPNHRQFFHSVAFGVLLGRGLLSLYRWQPDDDAGRLLRALGVVAGGAYLTHLIMDATTAKSIPLVGKL